MTDETIVAVYDTAAHADAAVRDLEAANVPSGAISRQSSAASGAMSATSGATSEDIAAPREQGFWSSLFGGEPDHDTAVYDRSVASGSHVVTVKVPEMHVASVTSILERHNPVDIDERAASYGLTGTGAATTTTTTTRETLGTTATAGAASTAASRDMASRDVASRDAGVGEQKIQLAEEQLSVGKRLVNRGTTRIRRFVVETPVEEKVSLHSERVSVERRPASGDARVTDADFTDKTIELTETAEEVVVAKTARVKEEIVVRKDATDRVETVRDTVRRQDVEITKDAGVETSVSGATGVTGKTGVTGTTGTTGVSGTTGTTGTTPVGTTPVGTTPGAAPRR